MELIWKLSDSDVNKVRDFVKKNMTPEVEKLMARNINHIDRSVDRDSILRAMLICLLSSDSDPYPEGKIEQIFNRKPYLLSYEYLFRVSNIESAFREVFLTSGNTKHINKVPRHFSTNFDFLEHSGWELESEIKSSLGHELTKDEERRLADRVDRSFKGFGSKEARTFLISLGITRYEIPIDHKFIRWLYRFDFPIRFSKTALQDILFYHFISDGVQRLCEISDVYPCVLYASVRSAANL